METIHVKVFHDTVCPWCRIGKKNLLTAIQELNKSFNDINISYQTFFLNRNIPIEGVDYEKYLTDKFEGISIQRINEMPTKIGKESGITFNFDKISKIPNTILSNVLIYLTPDDKKGQMIDRITELYFEQGEDIGDIQVLMKTASELNVSITQEQLTDEQNYNQVLQQDVNGKNLGITGVPFFIFEDKYALNGAQPVSAFKNVIQTLDGELENLV